MIKSIQNKVATLLSAAVLLLVPLAVPAIASAADIQGNVCGGTDLTVNTGGDCATDTESSTDKVQNIVTQGVNLFSVVVGIVAVIMIVVGGFRYITSGGDSGKVSSAKTTIIYALIGLVIVALAQFIVKFVLNKVTQTSS